MPVRIPHRKQTGVALITVLLVVFLAATAAAALASVQQLAIRRSGLLLHQQQARFYALGAEQWAAVILQRDLAESQTDHLSEEWATLPPVLPVEGGGISGYIEDLQGRFNLNNLLSRPSSVSKNAKAAQTSAAPTMDGNINGAQLKALRRLLEIIELDPDIAQAIADWIDSDQDPRFPGGAEDGEYLGRIPPYPAANRPLLGISELRLIRGIDQDTYARLAPYICALPVDSQSSNGTPLNLNTTTAPVLAAVADIELGQAESLLGERKPGGYASVDDFLAATKLAESTLNKDNLAVTSRHFLVRVEAEVGNGRAFLTSVLQRSEKVPQEGAESNTRILLRSFGHDD
jgi:general secretion pathway protein K